MQPDLTYKTIFAHPFMVEELVRLPTIANLNESRDISVAAPIRPVYFSRSVK